MTGEERVLPLPGTPEPKARSTVRLRKLGTGSATPLNTIAKKPGHRQKFAATDSPIAFPIDSPVHLDQSSRQKGNTGRRKKYVSARTGTSASGRKEHVTAQAEGVDLIPQASTYAAVREWLKYDDGMLEDDEPPQMCKTPTSESPSAMEAEDPCVPKQEASGLGIPSPGSLHAEDRTHGGTILPTPGQPSTKSSPRKRKPTAAARAVEGSGDVQVVSSRQARKNFEIVKREQAETFLKELDDTIAGGRLSKLAASTGGVKLNWTNKLNTTAGRANWKRESVQTGPAGQTVTQYRHHASIDIAEKVIDNEHRLLNVIAHEFCHLANFMISGVTGNPHGKEFKSWASKCSEAFSERGIQVTTKHSYDIDFKYIWTCAVCMLEYKRHSKSIDPTRHRCGACQGTLQQIKPTPRAGGTGKSSEYQVFLREQMKVVRAENPKVPQKEIMRLVAQKWAASPRKGGDGSVAPVETTTDKAPDMALRDVTDQLNSLDLGGGN
ncbi:uncharacterized protein DNG_07761 [Cephalotrichum gorgonifer]|uniref:SprT-like domain-containing protein n=1 Tax=Cephalotrichum gorgonifer TaxID=2041049 RepID=A0AAE8N282_9PEZI|nr:uncharacterized protein DNG_07761 [Cephalotrichum gorgonifer]